MLAQDKINQFKKKLGGEKATILQEIRELEKTPEFGEGSADLDAEEADEAEETSTNLALIHTLKERLREIDDALSKIVNGEKYGVCEKCGHDIEIPLLEVNPESGLCKECKLTIN